MDTLEYQPRKIFVGMCHPLNEQFDAWASELVAKHASCGDGSAISSSAMTQRQTAAVWVLTALHRAYHCGIKYVIFPIGSDKFKQLPFGSDAACRALDALESAGLITIKKAARGPNIDKATELYFTTKLAKTLKQAGLSLAGGPYIPLGEVVIVRDKDDFLNEKWTVPTPNDPEVAQMRDEIHAINDLLARTTVALYLPDSELRQLIAGETEYHCDLQAKSLRRIFVQERLDRCGRFFGGFWQGLPSRYRSRITINVESIVELDFSATILHLLYAREGLVAPEDPYGLSINPEADPDKRDLIKKYIAALLNAKRRYGLPKASLKLLGVTQSELRSVVEQKHHQVKHHFETGIGLELMFTESEIARRVLLTMTGKNIATLPIHDGFIVQARYKSDLYESMYDAFLAVTGNQPEIKQVLTQLTTRTGRHRIYNLHLGNNHRSVPRTKTGTLALVSH